MKDVISSEFVGAMKLKMWLWKKRECSH